MCQVLKFLPRSTAVAMACKRLLGTLPDLWDPGTPPGSTWLSTSSPGLAADPPTFLEGAATAEPTPPPATPLAPPRGSQEKKPPEQNYTFNLEKLGGPSQLRAPSPRPPLAGEHWFQERFIFNNAIYIPLST